jgi:hypothetical protein
MHINIDEILSSIPDSAYAHSNQYFSNDHRLRQIGFSAPLDTDIFIETSFSLPGKIPLTGALLKSFNNDNMEHERYMFYELSMTRIETRDMVTLQLQKPDIFSYLTITNLLKTIPLLSLIIFNLLILILPKFLGNILAYLGLGALLIVSIVYIVMGVRFCMQYFHIQKCTIAGQEITYLAPGDSDVLQEAQVMAIAQLISHGVNTVVFYKDRCYIKQEIRDTTKENTPLSAEDVQKQIAETISYLRSDPFTSLFI